MSKRKFNRYLYVLLRAIPLVVLFLGLSHIIPGIRSVFAVPIIIAAKTDRPISNHWGGCSADYGEGPNLVIDQDNDGVADPGDTLRYFICLGNAGVFDADGVAFWDSIDFNTTLVAGSVKITPIARHDYYAITSNVGITVPASSGVLVNDNDPDGGSVAVTSFDSLSAQAVSAGLTTPNVSVAADGSFTYDPPPGFEGTDSFSYTVIDDEGQTDSANVFFTVSSNASQPGNLSLVKSVEEVTAKISLASFISKAEEKAGVLMSNMVSSYQVTPAYANGGSINLTLGILNPGQVVWITFDVSIDEPFPTSLSFVCNQGLIEGINFADVFTDDPTTGAIDDATCTPIITEPPDMRITKDDGGATVAAGDTIDYTLTFTNVGSADATGVVITESVPSNTTFNAGASTSGWACVPDSSAGSLCTIAIGVVTGGGGGGQVDFAVDVDRPLASGETHIFNAAEVADDGTGGADPNPVDNFDTDSTLVVNTPPELAVDQDTVIVDEGQTAANSGTYSDADNDPVTLSASVGTITNNNDGTWSWSFATSDGPAESQTVTITADDGEGGASQVNFELTVNNVAPSINTITAPTDPVSIDDQPINISSDFSDPAGTHDEPYICMIEYGDGSTAQTGAVSGTPCTGSHTYADAGIFTVLVTVTDKDGDSGSAEYQFVVIYDPSGGFVTGGGWIGSPAGAYIPDLSLTGKATFGFVSKYKRSASRPDGSTEFQFKAGDLNFHSNAYDWLVIAGAKAKYKGVGTINGMGNYGFLLSAIDANLTPSTDVDLFRIKIWDKDNSDAVVYDNQAACLEIADDADPCTQIGGGSIVIHKGKK